MGTIAVDSTSSTSLVASQLLSNLGQTAPTVLFPLFNGENPNLWKTQAEQYFAMFNIHESFWVPMAILNFTGSAGIWLQSVQKKLGGFDWNSFTSLICTRFGRDRHQLLIRQFYAIKQTSSVAEYIERFEVVMNHLISYSEDTHPFYFLTRFVEGLRADIRAVVLVQRPQDLDTACSLALLQEEVAEGEIIPALPHQQFRQPPFFRPTHATVSTIQSRPSTPHISEDRRGTEASRAQTDSSKIAALRNFRRARGLCFKCGERWGKEHVCPAQVQMHVVEELLAMFSTEEIMGEGEEMYTAPSSPETLCALSLQAISGTDAPTVVQIHAWIQGKEILLLVDSGSTTSFINDQLASHMSNIQKLPSRCRVKVADGSEMLCTEFVSGCKWISQGHEFSTDFKILKLGVYDAILGLDWLKQHSPMKIDWQRQLFEVTTEKGYINLQGVNSSSPTVETISGTELLSACKSGAVAHMIHLCTLQGDSATTSVPLPSQIQQLLDDYADIFTEPHGLPPRRECDHRIPLVAGAQPINSRPYRHKPELKTEIERQVTELLDSGVIQKSSSPFSSPAILVKKKDGTWRLCVDYRGLNSLTIISKYPVPVIDELCGSVWFSKLDLRAGYHQIRLAEGEEEKTAFQTHSGHWEYKVMPFGLAGAPATFLGAMNSTLRPLLRKCVIVFFDDILVYSKSLTEHTQHLQQVLQLLRKDQWKVKFSKCAFGQQQISYLGHVVNSAGVSTDPSKIQSIAQWPTPVSAKQVRSFLGLAGYYRKFVKHFGIIARPLFNLLKKQIPFVWTEATNTAFELLKQNLISAPLLALPNFHKQFTIDTDACEYGVGAVLQQEGHPIAYMSKALGHKNRGLSTYEKECLAILMAVEQWRPYLHHQEFLIRTDQRSLVHLDDQRLTTQWQQKAFTKLLGLRYRIIYRKGTENSAADSLSRLPTDDTAELQTISICHPAWIDDIKASYTHNTHAQKILVNLQNVPDPKKRFHLQDGLIYFRNRQWLGGANQLQLQMLRAFHDSTVGGHSGFPVTYRRLRSLFAWPKMKQQVRNYVQTCNICQQAKPERVNYPGLLQPLPTPEGAWHTITMDFIDGLPQSRKFNCILVIVDKFTRYAHFLPLQHPFTAAKVALSFLDNIYKLHGLPKIIISDRDPVFTSKFWKELFQNIGTELRMSTPYHPQTDGQTERVNQCVETYLRCFIHAYPKRWSYWLSLAEFWYNNSYHSAIKTTPFVALYGRDPRHWGIVPAATCKVPVLQEWIEERKLMQELLQQNLHRARQQMKDQADKHRTERSFSVGDSVFIKLQPYVQSSVERRSNHKLAFRYFGPFTVTRVINPVAYEIQLPTDSQIHPVMHVSQLRKALLPGITASPTLPVYDSDPVVPVELLDTRWRKINGDLRHQGRVRWSDPLMTETSWEDLDWLRHRFPNTETWGQVSSQGGGDVSAPSTTTTAPCQPGTSQGQERRIERPRRLVQPNRKYAGDTWTT